MTQLLQLKEREKKAARDGWQKKVEDLLDQVTMISLRIRSYSLVAGALLPINNMNWL